MTATLTILLYFVQPPGEVFTQAEQQRAAQSITQAAEWWHVRRGDVFRVEVVEQPPTADDKSIAVYVLPQSARPIDCAGVQALGCSTWHTIRLIATDKPWIPAHELGHALYLLPDLTEGIDIMNPYAAQAAYQHDHTYLPMVMQ